MLSPGSTHSKGTRDVHYHQVKTGRKYNSKIQEKKTERMATGRVHRGPRKVYVAFRKKRLTCIVLKYLMKGVYKEGGVEERRKRIKRDP